MSLRFKLLGSPAIFIHDNSVSTEELRSVKARALLFYLVITKTPHTRQSLASLLYANNRDPLRSLRDDISKLRPLFDKYIKFGRKFIAWQGKIDGSLSFYGV